MLPMVKKSENAIVQKSASLLPMNKRVESMQSELSNTTSLIVHVEWLVKVPNTIQSFQ